VMANCCVWGGWRGMGGRGIMGRLPASLLGREEGEGCGGGWGEGVKVSLGNVCVCPQWGGGDDHHKGKGRGKVDASC
jgi:hypothetical protein